jgi:hypothetical protein
MTLAASTLFIFSMQFQLFNSIIRTHNMLPNVQKPTKSIVIVRASSRASNEK